MRQDPKLTLLTYPVLFRTALSSTCVARRSTTARVRLAIALGIDRREIVTAISMDLGAGYGPLPPMVGVVAPSARSRPLPIRRKNCLGDHRMPFELLTVGSGEAPLEQMLQAQLARAGFEVTIRQVELTAFLDRVYGPRHDFQAAVLGVQGDLGLGYLQTLARISGLPVRADPVVAVRMFRDSLPVAFLYHARGVQGMNRRVQGVRMDLRGELRRWCTGGPSRDTARHADRVSRHRARSARLRGRLD